MGNISHFDLTEFEHIDTFVETGTGYASSTRILKKHFKDGYSIEIHPGLIAEAKKELPDVVFINNISEVGLKQLLPNLNKPVLFWLDAHYPADYGLGNLNLEITLPLERELKLIAQRIGKYKDIILIDDARIYLKGNFQSGNLPPSHIGLDGIDFIYQLFSEDLYNIKVDFEDEGYISIIPK